MALAHNNERPNIPLTVCIQTVAEQWGICGITPALKWAMLAYFYAWSPLKVGGITKILQCFWCAIENYARPHSKSRTLLTMHANPLPTP
jgi:hypothetical protein